MALSLGIINFGVEADTTQLDNKLDKSEQKISRFANAGLRNFGKLNNVSINKINKQLNTTHEKLEKNQRQAQRTLNEIQELENAMNKIKSRVADTSGLNLKFDTSQKTKKPMSTTEYSDKLDKLALEDAEYNKILNKQIKLVEKAEEQAITIGKCKEKISIMKNELNNASKSNFFKTGFTKINKQVSTLGQNIKRNVGMTLKMLGSMLVMSVVFGTINKAISNALDGNEQLNANLDYLYYSLGQAITPILEWVVKLCFSMMSYIGAAAKLLTGTNPFANSLSKYMSKTAKSTKEIKNNLGDIDEIHNIDDSSSGTGSISPEFNLETGVETTIDNFKTKISQLKTYGTGTMDKIIDHCNQDFIPKFGKVGGSMLNVTMPVFGDIFKTGKQTFESAVGVLEGISEGDWPKVWENLRGVVSGSFSQIWQIITAPFKIAWNLIKLGFTTAKNWIGEKIDDVKNKFDEIKNKWNDIWDKLKKPNIKMPHFKIDWEYNGIRAEAAKKVGLPGWPKLGVDWYAKGGGFGEPNVIGVGEYIGARSNPEVVAPQNMIYEMAVKANNDSNKNENGGIVNFVNELKINGKVLAKEIIEDLDYEAKRRGYKPILQKG